jgi:hypothetical protein
MKHSTLRFLAIWVAGSGLWAQTQVDLRTQGKDVDFRTAQSTKPLKSGATLPATCTIAEMFFLNTASAGANIYACSATNIWVLESGGGSSTTPGGLDTYCQFNDEGAFGGNSGCRYNKTTQVLTAAGGIDSGDGSRSSGITLPELSANGSSYFGIYGADSQSASGCIIVSGSPANSGDGLVFTGTTANTTEVVPKTCKVMQWGSAGLSGSATLNFGSVSSGACGSNTFTVTGATQGARIAAGYPEGLESGLIGTMVVSASNTVTVRLCNFSGSAVDPAAGVFSAAIF